MEDLSHLEFDDGTFGLMDVLQTGQREYLTLYALRCANPNEVSQESLDALKATVQESVVGIVASFEAETNHTDLLDQIANLLILADDERIDFIMQHTNIDGLVGLNTQRDNLIATLMNYLMRDEDKTFSVMVGEQYVMQLGVDLKNLDTFYSELDKTNLQRRIAFLEQQIEILQRQQSAMLTSVGFRKLGKDTLRLLQQSVSVGIAALAKRRRVQ